MNLRKTFSRFLLISFVVLTLGLFHFTQEGLAGASQPPKSKTTTVTAKKPSVKRIKTHPEPSQAEFEARRSNAEPTKSGMFAQAGMTDISDNPGFFTVKNITPGPGVPQDIDKLIRPVLKQLFKDAKLVEDIGEQPPRIDGEVEENKLVYVARQLLVEADGDQLHTVLDKEAGFSLSPRLGAKPTHIRGHQKVWMSLLKSTSLRGYSFVIEVNYGTQRITVISYRLGSKYDRFG
jgi:hypothetical protein